MMQKNETKPIIEKYKKRNTNLNFIRKLVHLKKMALLKSFVKFIIEAVFLPRFNKKREQS